ncbi:MAG: endonuclease MutS2 [Dehalococcoidia bacterium]
MDTYQPDLDRPGSTGADDLRVIAENLLEFPRVRQMLAGRARFFLSRELALRLTPQTHREDVDRLQDEAAEACLMLDTVGDIGLTGAEDPRPLLRRAALDGMLTGQEMVGIVHLFDSIWLARRVVESMKGRAPRMEALAAEIPDLRDVKERIFEALSDRGDVLDSATPRLGPLREQAARAYRRLVRQLERLSADSSVRSALQSTAIATRGDRLVLEVKSDHRRAVPGIVHDVSQSGATLFVEPFRAVEACNEWRELAAEAQREEERVLRRLSRILGDREPEAVAALEAAADLDFIAARGRLSRAMHAVRPETLEAGSEPALRLFNARHPFLGESAVPVTVSIGPGFRGLVITGPNTGGKTVALKTMGLLALMHQSGLQLPVSDGSAMSVFDAVYADIGDAQSIERSVSTFSSHMGNVVRIVGEAGPTSLVLLDELGTGTDPEEGSALARAVLAHLLDNNVPVAITTHHRAVAEFAGGTGKAQNASVELDPETLLPTYHLIMGIPGRSYALHVASHLGLPKPILEHADSMLDPSRAQAETLLNQIQRERDELRKANEKAAQELSSVETARKELQTRLSQVTRQQEDLVERTRRELRNEADNIRRTLRRVVDEAKADTDLAAAQRAVSRVRHQVAEPTWFPIGGVDQDAQDETAPLEEQPLRAGDSVEIKGLNVRAEVVGVSDNGSVDLRMGNARIQLNARQLRRVSSAGDRPLPQRPDVRISAAPSNSTSGELDIRGVRVHEAEELVSDFLDQCALQGLDRCRIIHGTGTGALREAVRDILAGSPHVVSFAPAARPEGGNGVTVAELG